MQNISCSSDSSLKEKKKKKHQVIGGICNIVRFMLTIEWRRRVKSKVRMLRPTITNYSENKGTYCFQMLFRNLSLLFAITMEMKILLHVSPCFLTKCLRKLYLD